MLALQAQRKARSAATSPTRQLNLFTSQPLADNSEACIDNNNRQSIPEATPTNLNLALNFTTGVRWANNYGSAVYCHQRQ